MHAAAFILMMTLSREERLTCMLRSVRQVVVQYDGHTMFLKQPAALLAHLRVTEAVKAAVDGEPSARIWFGGHGPYEVWPEDGLWDLTRDGWGVDLAPGFLEELNRAVSKLRGERIDLRKRRERSPGVPGGER